MKNLPYIIIAGLLVIIILMRECTPGCKEVNNQDTIKTNKLIYDSIPYAVPVRVPVPADTITVPVPADVDTAAILRLFFTKYYYSQTIEDTNLRAVIRDTIHQNKIFSREFTYQWLRPVKVEQTIIAPADKKAFKVYAGFNLSGSKDGFTGVGPSLILKTKKDNVYFLGNNLLEKQPNVSLGTYWRLGKK